MSTFASSASASRMWCAKKRKREAEKHMDEEDDEGIQIPFPLLFPNKMMQQNIYSTNNHVFFNDNITFDTAFALNKELRAVAQRVQLMSVLQGTELQPIYLHLTTNGGDIYAAFSVIDTMKQLHMPVFTVIDGFVASAGTLISTAGERRFISKNAYMLIHELRSQFWGKMSEIEEEFSNLQKMMAHIVAHYMECTNIPRKKLDKILVKDSIWNAAECIEHGIVDEIME